MVDQDDTSGERISIMPVSIGDRSNRCAALLLTTAIDEAERTENPDVQEFEEGKVLLATDAGSRTVIYYMQLRDMIAEGDASCARMHTHPYGDRDVTIFTGEETTVVIASLLLPRIINDPRLPSLNHYEDQVDIVQAGGEVRNETRYCVDIPPDSRINVYVPQGVPHCFNAYGPQGAAAPIHPDEATELAVTGATTSSMAAQTRFLEPPGAQANCPADISQTQIKN